MAPYTGTSIVDYLASIGQPNDFATRKALATARGITNYTGTATQNTQLLGMLRTTPTQTSPTTTTQPSATTPQPSTQSAGQSGPAGQSSGGSSILSPSMVTPSSQNISANGQYKYYVLAGNNGTTIVPIQLNAGQPDPGPGYTPISESQFNTYKANLNPSGDYVMSGGNAAPSAPRGYSGNSIVDYLASIGQPNDFASRAAKAASLGIQNYTGTAAQNTQMLTMLRTASAPSAPSGSAAGSGTGQGAPSSTLIPGTNIESTGSETLDQLLSSLHGVVVNNLSQGNTVNPNLQITPDLVNKFLTEAHTMMDPEGQQLLTNEIKGVNASLKNLGEQYGLSVGEKQAQFEQDVNQERNASGAAGIGMSGVRGLAENYMLGSQNRSLASLASNAEKQMGDVLRAGGSSVGAGAPGLSGSVNDFVLPSLSRATSTLEGARGGAGSGSALNYNYNSGDYKVGSVPQQYLSALTGGANEFLTNYLGSAANNSRKFVNVNGTPTLQ